MRELVFATNCFAAAMLALFISFQIGLERPFWAMATVYITSQPLSGAVRSKAVFRLIGTIVGAGAAVLLVPLFVNAPLLLSLALAAWVAGCQFVSLLDRTPRSYLFMLAGYTAALIGFPAVAHPEAIFDVAVLRAQEIGIGVACAALIHAVVWPLSVTALLSVRVRAVLGETEAWIVEALTRAPGTSVEAARRRLAADITELHVMATHVPFDTARVRPARATLAALQDRFILLLPLVSAVDDRIRSLTALGPLPPALDTLIGDVAAWVGDGDEAAAQGLAGRCEALGADLPADDWAGLLAINLTARLRELIDALQTTRAVAAQVMSPGAPVPPSLRVLLRERRRRPLHRDYPLALLSAAATLVAILGCCAFWILSGWQEGAVAAMIAAVICCFFATMDDPVPAQRGFLVWTALSIPLTALYLFALLPMVHGFETLALVLAPPLLMMGVMMADPAWYGRMVPMIIGFAGGLALTNSFSADAAAFFNTNVAQLAGVAAAIVATRLFRALGAGTAIRRVRRAAWGEMAAIGAVPAPADTSGWQSRMLDRIGLLAARASDVEEQDEDVLMATLRELRLGVSLTQLGQAGPATASEMARLQSDIGAHYRALARRGERPPDAALLTRIDAAIDAERGHSDDRRQLAALAGLRRNLFPDAPAWRPVEQAA